MIQSRWCLGAHWAKGERAQRADERAQHNDEIMGSQSIEKNHECNAHRANEREDSLKETTEAKTSIAH